MLSFNISLPLTQLPSTKRQLTSEIASLFDPLGYCSPVVIAGKHILQQLWSEKLDWDAVAPRKYINAWEKIRNELHFISELRIQRWVEYGPNDMMELHGFSDASELGYSASIYITNKSRKTSFLLMAKAKVCPIKQSQNCTNVTIPRLELCGALLLAQLTKRVQNALEIEFNRVCLWSDSKIVLDWIHADPRRYKTFIGSRISKINQLFDKSVWAHVPSELNAADCASRGILPSELISHPLWWHGPQFLIDESTEPPRYVPQQKANVEIQSNVAEVVNKPAFTLLDISSYTKLKRVIGYCLRFMNNCRGKAKQHGPITCDEMKAAEQSIVRVMQKDSKNQFGKTRR